MADPATDDIWSTLGAKPAAAASAAPAAADDDAIWSTLGTGKPTTEKTGSSDNPSTLSTVISGLERGAHQGLDVPAEALAGAGDWVARQFGYDTNQQAQTKAGDVAFNQPYDADPNNRTLLPTTARVAGNLLTTLPAALGAGGIAGGAARLGMELLPAAAETAAPMTVNALRYLPSAVGGAASGATVSAQTGEPIGEGALSGGILGAALPAVMDAGNALLGSQSPAVAQAVTQFGIPLRTGQVSGSGLVRFLDDITAPESSNAAQRTAVTTAAARTMGVTPEMAAANDLPAGQMTPKTMAFAQKLNGGIMNDVENRTTIDGAPALDLVTRLRDIATDAAKTPSAFDDVKPHIQDIIDSISKNDGVLPGNIYGNLVAHGTPLDVATGADNGVVKYYAGQIKSALQDAMQASATPEDAASYAQARSQYKNMMTLAPLVNKGIPGQISPLLLQGAANRSFKSNAFRGAGDLGDLGDVAQQFLKTPPQSGTEPRQLMRATLYGRIEELGRVLASITAKPAVQTVLGTNPLAPLGTVTPGARSWAVPTVAAIRNQLQPPPSQ